MKKDVTNGMMYGVCAGIAKEFDVDVSLVRLGFAIGALMGLGLPIAVYIVLAIILPKD